MSPKIIRIAKEKAIIPITNCMNNYISYNFSLNDFRVIEMFQFLRSKTPIAYLIINQVVISKIFQKVFSEQIGNFAKKILLPRLGGLGKGRSLQKGLFDLTKDIKTIRINLV